MVYPTFEAAITSRIRRYAGPLARPLIAAALRQVEPRIGVPPDSLRPIEALRRLDVPTFVIAGTEDPYTPPEQTRALYAAAPEPKALWLVEGGGHGNLYRTAPDAYEAHVTAFFDAHLHAFAAMRPSAK